MKLAQSQIPQEVQGYRVLDRGTFGKGVLVPKAELLDHPLYLWLKHRNSTRRSGSFLPRVWLEWIAVIPAFVLLACGVYFGQRQLLVYTYWFVIGFGVLIAFLNLQDFARLGQTGMICDLAACGQPALRTIAALQLGQESISGQLLAGIFLLALAIAAYPDLLFIILSLGICGLLIVANFFRPKGLFITLETLNLVRATRTSTGFVRALWSTSVSTLVFVGILGGFLDFRIIFAYLIGTVAVQRINNASIKKLEDIEPLLQQLEQSRPAT